MIQILLARSSSSSGSLSSIRSLEQNSSGAKKRKTDLQNGQPHSVSFFDATSDAADYHSFEDGLLENSSTNKLSNAKHEQQRPSPLKFQRQQDGRTPAAVGRHHQQCSTNKAFQSKLLVQYYYVNNIYKS